MLTVRVNLGPRSYAIEIAPGLIRAIWGRIAAAFCGRKIIALVDENVLRLHHDALACREPQLRVERITFPGGEATKSLAAAEQAYRAFARLRIDRQAVLIAIGGGVISDLGGFIAGTWMRGIDFVVVPTTLEAAIDASVGGKSALNLPEGKNLVGVFHQPAGVFVDPELFATLTARDVRAGLAESVKHAAIADAALLAWHERYAERILALDAACVSELIAWNCRIKAAVVEADEREAGRRAILNHGHTVGHALEHVLGYELRHGECVALGMLVENELSVRRGLLSAAEALRIRALLTRLELPTTLPRPIEREEFLRALALDKKSTHDRPNYALLRAIGETCRAADISDDEIWAALAGIQAS